MLREFVTWTVIVLLAFGMLGFGWLTRHPDAAWLEDAEDWPLVGPLAERFRRAYLGPPEEERAAAEKAEEGDDGPEIVIIRPPVPDEPIRLPPSYYEAERQAARRAGGGDRPAPPTREARPRVTLGELAPDPNAKARVERPRTVVGDLPSLAPLIGAEPPIREIYERQWVLPGTVLRAEPAAGAAEVGRTRELASVPVLERRGEWLRVRLRGREGWADPATPAVEVRAAGRGSYHGRYAAQPWGEALTLVKQRLGLRRPNQEVGPFDLYSDVEDEELLELLGTVAERLGEAYSQRFGIGLPKHRRPPTVALFADHEDYLAVVAAFPDLPPHVRGFAPRGLGIFYVGDDPHMAVVGTFVHETTHVFNRYAIGSALPPWLEEGLASDLGGVWMEDPHAPMPGVVRAREGRRGWLVQRTVGQTLTVADQPPSLAMYQELVNLDHAGFHDDDSAWHYAQSMLFVRCLLDADRGAMAAGFRRFLADVAAGFPARPERLSDRLGRSWPEVERICRGHHRALVAEAQRLTTWSESRPAVAAE